MNGKICFIDADIFVHGLLERDKTKHKASRNLLEQIEQGSLYCMTDYLVLTEAFYILENYKGRQTAIEMIKKVLSLHNLEILPLDSSTFFESLKRVGKYRLKINDLIHYTIALLRNAEGIYSYDKDFNGLEIARVEP
jgi:predicted nucleic acid-binding protein